MKHDEQLQNLLERVHREAAQRSAVDKQQYLMIGAVFLLHLTLLIALMAVRGTSVPSRASFVFQGFIAIAASVGATPVSLLALGLLDEFSLGRKKRALRTAAMNELKQAVFKGSEAPDVYTVLERRIQELSWAHQHTRKRPFVAAAHVLLAWAVPWVVIALASLTW